MNTHKPLDKPDLLFQPGVFVDNNSLSDVQSITKSRLAFSKANLNEQSTDSLPKSQSVMENLNFTCQVKAPKVELKEGLINIQRSNSRQEQNGLRNRMLT